MDNAYVIGDIIISEQRVAKIWKPSTGPGWDIAINGGRPPLMAKHAWPITMRYLGVHGLTPTHPIETIKCPEIRTIYFHAIENITALYGWEISLRRVTPVMIVLRLEG